MSGISSLHINYVGINLVNLCKTNEPRKKQLKTKI